MLVTLLLLCSGSTSNTRSYSPNDETRVKAVAWENATNESLLRARACLPLELQAFYLPNLTLATAGATDTTAALECEQLVLFHTYQRLSTAFNICRALAHGVRLCAHFLAEYESDKNLTPSAMPRRSLLATTAMCETRIAAIASKTTRTAILENFRHRFSNGTICLRANTVHGRVPTFLI